MVKMQNVLHSECWLGLRQIGLPYDIGSIELSSHSIPSP
jgi:hypothetical protein